jgi:hypothetical protein
MTALPLAHLSDHWWMYLLYGLPVAVVLYSAARETIRGRRERRAAQRGPNA